MEKTAGRDGMGWDRLPEGGVRAVGGNPADTYDLRSTRPRPGREGLAAAPGDG